MLIYDVSSLFEREKIRLFGVLPKEELTIKSPEILARYADFEFQSAIIFAVPYFGGQPYHLSAYAASRDYHLYFKQLHVRLIEGLKRSFPQGHFVGFSDHSPIDERLAAVKCGIGVFGCNGLVLTEDHSSYIFLGEILTDVAASSLGDITISPIRSCENCGACRRACPTGILRGGGSDCLSAITQRKGALSEEEKRLMKAYGTAWGCDECQRCCPWTKRAAERGTLHTEIPFFLEDRLEKLTVSMLEEMPKEDFQKRAFAWRGRETILRNVKILEEN